MSPKELRTVKSEVASIYRLWHMCGLKKAERGIPKGTLCDSCLEAIDAHMDNIKAKAKP